jgi:hypothetical protein
LVRSQRKISVDSGFISFNNLAVFDGLDNSLALDKIQNFALVLTFADLLQIQLIIGNPHPGQL